MPAGPLTTHVNPNACAFTFRDRRNGFRMPMNKSALCSSASWSKASYAMWVGRLAIRFARDEGDCAPFKSAHDFAIQRCDRHCSAKFCDPALRPAVEFMDFTEHGFLRRPAFRRSAEGVVSKSERT